MAALLTHGVHRAHTHTHTHTQLMLRSSAIGVSASSRCAGICSRAFGIFLKDNAERSEDHIKAHKQWTLSMHLHLSSTQFWTIRAVLTTLSIYGSIKSVPPYFQYPTGFERVVQATTVIGERKTDVTFHSVEAWKWFVNTFKLTFRT